MTSIRGYLVTVLIALLTLTSFLAALQGYRQSSQQAARLFDQDLQVLVASLLDLYQEVPSASAVAAPSEQSRAGLNAVQVFRNGQMIYRNHSAPTRPINAAVGFSEQNFLGQRWRTYTLRDEALQLEVVTAQPLYGRQHLTNEVVLASIYPIVLSLPLQALLIWLAVSRGLAPLRHVAEQLADKKADDLSPLQLLPTTLLSKPLSKPGDLVSPAAGDTVPQNAKTLPTSGSSLASAALSTMPSFAVQHARLPSELVPVFDTTNHLLARLREAFEREKRFAADVAHELRTPLSVLQVQLFNAEQRWLAAQLPLDELTALKSGVERMSQLIEQILLLNRTNAAQFQARLQPLDLVELCRDQLVELYGQFEAKQQDIELISDSIDALQGAPLLADAFALPLLVKNLMVNANKYTPLGGHIRVSVSPQDVHWCIEVADSGPGIAPSEYSKVFQRFYRVGGDRQRETGSGLGLAICAEIAQLHQGYLQLGTADLGGLSVKLFLPKARGAS